MKFFKEFRIGDGEIASTRKIIINCFKCLSPKSSSMRVHTSLIFLLRLFMELGIMVLREEEMSIIGEFGQEVLNFKVIKQLLESSIASSELKPYLYGKLFFKE